MAKKTVYLATTPDNTETVTRTSARAYTHALALRLGPNAEEIGEGWVRVATKAEIPAEAWEAKGKPEARPTDAHPDGWIYWGPKVVREASEGGWGIYSFHGSEALALKAAAQLSYLKPLEARAVPVSVKA